MTFTLWGRTVDREFARRHAGHLEQLAGIDMLEFTEADARGVRVARIRTGRLDVDILIDRGMDPARASVDGIPFAWLSPTGVRHPAFAENSGWGPLRTFTGGLLTTCGLDHAMGPATNPGPGDHPAVTTVDSGMHGRVSALPARIVHADTDWDTGTITLIGEIRQASLWGETLVLRRTITASIGGTDLFIDDVVRNEGRTAWPCAILYHVNLGWPLLDANSSIGTTASGPVQVSREGVDWAGVPSPEDGAPESVAQFSSGTGRQQAWIANPDIGDGRALTVKIEWEAEALPHLIEWRSTAPTHYVVGLEPSNVGMGGPAEARDNGTLRILQPGESAVLGISIHCNVD